MRMRTLLPLVSLLVSNMACAWASQWFGDVETVTNGSNQSGDILFEDDFSDPSSGWDQFSDENGLTDYDNGAYRIRVDADYVLTWANPGLDSLPPDLRVQVEATKSGGPDFNEFGLICRYRESATAASFYQFVVTSDGYAGIILVRGNEQSILTRDNLYQFSEAIKLGSATNQLTAECIGNTFNLYVNDVLVDSVQDDTLTDGDVGLVVGSYDETGVDILFDNFLVTIP